jgi:hydrogenase-4 component F
MWVAVEGATLATALMVSLYRTREAIEAAWKYFILCGVGIALALFGTILMYLAAQPVMGGGAPAMAWQLILGQVARFDPAILNLAFVFLLAATAPRSGWRRSTPGCPDAHAEGPTPISAVLSGLLLNVALYAVLRFKILLAAQRRRHRAGAADGDVWVCRRCCSPAFMLYRRRDIKRLFRLFLDRAYGHHHLRLRHGRPLANFAGLLHMTMHSLTKSAIFFSGRPYRAGEGLAEDRRHPRAHRQPPQRSAGPSSLPCWQSPDAAPRHLL